MEAINSVSNFGTNASKFAEGIGKHLGGSKGQFSKGQSMGGGMEALLGGFILVVVAIYLVAEGRTILAEEEAELDSIDVALFGVVFIVLISGIALWVWNKVA